ncbi:HAD family hydrolase [Sphingobacterium sp. LRF_L2]|uniref:HAD family hydrolase n=1 Tax=Sphingobacterium sp. LRF_L2 TaxID=3369421 RepID=UPI003F5F43D1
MNDVKNILFDLDGTLTDPAEGITKCIAYALDSFGIETLDLHSLRAHIGPPLKDTFMEVYSFDEETALQAVAKYRERFSTVGLYENLLFDGVPSFLEELKSKGYGIFLATSKPEIFAKEIIRYFELTSFFDFIGGSALDDSRPTKADVIRHVMEGASLAKADHCVMIGDRKHDILGAKTWGMSSIGVLYGYGDLEELRIAGADYIVEDIPGLRNIFVC